MSHFFVVPCHLPPARSQSALLVKRCRSDVEPDEPDVPGEPGELGAPVLGPGDVGPGVVVPGVLGLGVLGLGDGLGEVDGLPVPDGLLLEGLLDEPLPDVPPPLVCADASAGAKPRTTIIPATISFFIEGLQFAWRRNRTANIIASGLPGGTIWKRRQRP